MSFLNPLVLLGLAAAAIPILVHLFNFRRPQRVDFPSLRFVHELERKAMRRVRLRQWLLLALRTLAIMALVLAFARPLLPSAWRVAFGSRPPSAIALVLDNSQSMARRDAQGSYFDQAREIAAAIADAAPAGDAMVLVPTAGAGRAPRLSATAAPLLDAMDELEPRHGAEALSSVAAGAGSLLESDDRPRRDIYLVSDLQSATLVDSVAAGLPAGTRVTLVPIGVGQQANTAITDVRVVSRIIEPARPVRISVTVARHGGSGGRVPVRVILEGEPVAESVVDVTPGTSATAVFSVTPPRPGWIAGEARLAEGDAFASDDARPFVFNAPAARRVLLAAGDGTGAAYVRLALALAAETGSIVVNEVPERALAAAGLAAYDVVVVLGPRAPGTDVARALANFVESGGGVLLVPHEAPESGASNALLAALGGGRLEGFMGAPNGPSLGALGDVDMDHPLVAGLLADDGAGRLEGPEVSYAARYAPGGGHEVTIARLAAGAPFLQEIRRGRGASLLLTVAPDPEWSDLPTRALFAPLLLRAVDYLAGAGADGPADDALTAGRPGTLRLEGLDGDAPFELVAQDGVVVPTEARVVPGAVVLDVDAPARPGVYSVRSGDDVVRLVAVQPDARESDLRTLEPEAAAARLREATGAEVTVLDARGTAGAAAVERRGQGAPLWTVAVALALAFLLAETVVTTRWRVGTGSG